MNARNNASLVTLVRHIANGTSREAAVASNATPDTDIPSPTSTTLPTNDRERDLALVHRIHRLRTLGLALGFLGGASVLKHLDAHIGWWLLLVINAFVWPHVALVVSLRSTDPRRAEMRNLVIDSGLGGMWIAVMQFNLLPSVLLATLLSADKISIGGARLLPRTLSTLVATCAVTSALLGFPVSIATPMSVVAACMPILVVYPIAVSAAAYSLARKVALQNRRLEEVGRTDILTGLANRRQCFAEAEVELARHLRTGRPASLVILDIDHFKAINDRYGHPTGDDVLCGLASVLRTCCRTIDTPARYGGDEFMLILPETDLRGAQEVAERIRAQMNAFTLDRAPGMRCTVSLGAAEAGKDRDIGAWIQRADVALYRAKKLGRDRFEAAA